MGNSVGGVEEEDAPQEGPSTEGTFHSYRQSWNFPYFPRSTVGHIPNSPWPSESHSDAHVLLPALSICTTIMYSWAL